MGLPVTRTDLQPLLESITPTTSEGADLLLDLRQLLLSDGHPGKCVRCFFGLLGDLRQPGALKPLRHWLERHLEIEVSAGGSELEVLPVRLGGVTDLESYCHRAIATVREDRAFAEERIHLRFRFKSGVAAA